MSGEAIPFFQPHLTGPTDDEVNAAKATIDRRRAAERLREQDTLLRCTSQIATGKGCGEMSRIGDLTYIQTHWYTPAHGCSGGDYWNLGEGQWICPKCGHRNRLYATKPVEAMKISFKAVEDRYDDR